MLKFQPIIFEMETLYMHHQMFLQATRITFKRTVLEDIDWNDRLIAIKGSRGVGKTTLIAQHIIEQFKGDPRALYVSMDNLTIKSMSLFEIAQQHFNLGGTHLFIDEVHKYPDWSFAVKNIYDLIPQLNVVFTGSSMLAIHKSQADLSRRAIVYNLTGLSLREYINIETNNSFQKYSLEDVLHYHIDIAQSISKEIKVLKYFLEYLDYGYYPIYLEGKKKYAQKLQQIMNTILDVDLSYAMETNVHNIYKLKKFLTMLASSVPFEPNISKLAGSIEMPRNTLTQYIYSLDEAGIINVLLDSGKSYSSISKPEKLYMQNPNLLKIFTDQVPNKGTIREVFFANQLRNSNKINYTPKGDFLVNDKYIFEIGGKDKTYHQIANLPHSFIAADDVLTGVKNKVPMWLFGFLY